jgi:peptide/nickel transport system substrate-binding protein
MKVQKALIRSFAALAALALVALLLPLPARAQEIPVPLEDTVIIVRPPWTVWDKWNPWIPAGLGNWEGFFQVILEPLWYFNYSAPDPTKAIVYWLAEGFEYRDDYKTFVIRLRRGVTWSDGRPFTSRDVKFTIELVKRTPGLSPHVWAKEWIDSVETPDDYTVIIRLKKPNPRFHYNFRQWGTLYIMPAHVWEGKDPLTFTFHPPVGTGPYKFVRSMPELQMWIYERRDDYWACKQLGFCPVPKYVVYRAQQAADVERINVILGQPAAWVATDIFPVAMTKELMRYPNVTVVPFFDPCPRGLWINTRKYPLSLKEVRWAIAYAIDYDSLARAWPSATPAVPAPYPFPDWPSLREYRYPDVPTPKYDPTRAVQILEGLGFKRGPDGIWVTPNGTKLSFEILAWPTSERILAAIVAENLKAIGIDATVKAPPHAVSGELTLRGQFDLYLICLCTGMPWNLDPLNLLETFYTEYGKRVKPLGEPNPEVSVSRYVDPELDRIVDELRVLHPADPRAKELAHQGIKRLMEGLPVIPLTETIYEIVYTTKYWDNWPVPGNEYTIPPQWWPEVKFMLFKIRRPVKVEYVRVWITGAVERFRGVDYKWYGPYVRGEYVELPGPDAENLIAKGLASFTPPVAPEVEQAVKLLPKLSSDVEALKSAVNAISSRVDAVYSQVAGLSSALAAATALSVLTFILVLVLLAFTLRKPKAK